MIVKTEFASVDENDGSRYGKRFNEGLTSYMSSMASKMGKRPVSLVSELRE